jgi:hypothetical protein
MTDCHALVEVESDPSGHAARRAAVLNCNPRVFHPI